MPDATGRRQRDVGWPVRERRGETRCPGRVWERRTGDGTRLGRAPGLIHAPGPGLRGERWPSPGSRAGRRARGAAQAQAQAGDGGANPGGRRSADARRCARLGPALAVTRSDAPACRGHRPAAGPGRHSGDLCHLLPCHRAFTPAVTGTFESRKLAITERPRRRASPRRTSDRGGGDQVQGTKPLSRSFWGPRSPAIPGAPKATDRNGARGPAPTGAKCRATVQSAQRGVTQSPPGAVPSGAFRPATVLTSDITGFSCTDASRIPSPHQRPEPTRRATQGASRCFLGRRSPRRGQPPPCS